VTSSFEAVSRVLRWFLASAVSQTGRRLCAICHVFRR